LARNNARCSGVGCPCHSAGGISGCIAFSSSFQALSASDGSLVALSAVAALANGAEIAKTTARRTFASLRGQKIFITFTVG